jgi:hypothetical protein
MQNQQQPTDRPSYVPLFPVLFAIHQEGHYLNLIRHETFSGHDASRLQFLCGQYKAVKAFNVRYWN